MAEPLTARYPSQQIRYPVLTIHLSVTRNPGRLRLLSEVRKLARVQKETTASFVARALAREITRCKMLMSVEARIAIDDQAECELMAALTEEEKRVAGLL